MYKCSYWMLISLAALFPFQILCAESGNWSYSSSGIVDFRVQKNQLERNNLMPNPDVLGIKTQVQQQTSRINLKAWQGKFFLATQLRLVLTDDPEQSVQKTLDELYSEYSLTDIVFLYAGRRNIVFGQSYGTNPLDVFFDQQDRDRSLNENRQRQEIKGQDMIGFEILFNDNLSISGYWAPSTNSFNKNNPNRSLVAMKYFFSSWNMDFSLLAFKDKRPGTGLSFTKSISNSILLYGDITYRQGRDRLSIQDNKSTTIPGDIVTNEKSQSSYLESNLGLNYSFKSGTTLNLEYYYNQNAYSKDEWDEITRIININATNFNRKMYGNAPQENLLQLNSALRHNSLRQHYGFIRIFYPDFLGLGVSTEASMWHNLQDHSGIVSLRIEREILPSILSGAYVSKNYSKNNTSEFGLRSNQLSYTIYATFHF